MTSYSKIKLNPMFAAFIILIPFQLYFNIKGNLTVSAASILSAYLFIKWLFGNSGNFKKLQIKYTLPVDLPLLIFILVLFAGIMFSANKPHSVKFAIKWSSAMLIYYFISHGSFFEPLEDTENLLIISALAAAFMAIISYLEIGLGFNNVFNLLKKHTHIFSLFFEPETLDYKMKTLSMNWLLRQENGQFGIRAFGLFNCSIVYSAYAGLHIPILIALTWQAITSAKKKFSVKTLLYPMIFILNSIALYLTFTRSAIIAGGIAVTFLIILLLKLKIKPIYDNDCKSEPTQKINQPQKAKTIIILTFILAIVTTAVIILTLNFNKLLIGARTRFLSTNLEQQLTERIPLWLSAAKIISARPLTGAGTADYENAFIKYADAQNNPYYYRGDEYDNKFFTPLPPHNQYLSVWAENGLCGIIIYIWLLLSLFKTSVFIYRKGANTRIKIIGAGFISVWLWYSIQTIFTDLFYADKFSMLFWTFAGICSALYKYTATQLTKE